MHAEILQKVSVSEKTCLKINVRDSSFKFWPNFFSKMGHFSATIEDLVLIFGMAQFHGQFIILEKFRENLRPKCATSCQNCLIFSESDS